MNPICMLSLIREEDDIFDNMDISMEWMVDLRSTKSLSSRVLYIELNEQCSLITEQLCSSE